MENLTGIMCHGLRAHFRGVVSRERFGLLYNLIRKEDTICIKAGGTAGQMIKFARPGNINNNIPGLFIFLRRFSYV